MSRVLWKPNIDYAVFLVGIGLLGMPACSEPVNHQAFLGKTLAEFEELYGPATFADPRFLWYSLSEQTSGQSLSFIRDQPGMFVYLAGFTNIVYRISAVGTSVDYSRPFSQEGWDTGTSEDRQAMAKYIEEHWRGERLTSNDVEERLGTPDLRQMTLWYMSLKSPLRSISVDHVWIVVDGFDSTSRVVEIHEGRL